MTDGERTFFKYVAVAAIQGWHPAHGERGAMSITCPQATTSPKIWSKSVVLASSTTKIMVTRPAACFLVKHSTTVCSLNGREIPKVYFSSTSQPASFFSYTSGRAQRRRKLRERRRKRLEKQEETVNRPAKRGDEEYYSVKDILFPNPYKGYKFPEEERDRFRMPTSFSMFREAVSLTWEDYVSSWTGFSKSKGFLVEEKTEEEEKAERELAVAEKQKEISGNLKRNLTAVREEAQRVRKEVQAQTGISTTEDLKRIAGDMMRLATECLKEFMVGYRKGRDDEVENMLNKYFEEQEEEEENIRETVKRKRRPKRRVLKRTFS